MDFWSATSATVTVTNAAADLDFPNVTVANFPSGATILRVVALLKCRALNNTNAAANNLTGAKTLRIKASTGAWGTNDIVAISFVASQWPLAASTKEGGDSVVGTADLSSVVTGNGTFNFRSEQTNRAEAIVAAQSNIVLDDVQVALRLYFS